MPFAFDWQQRGSTDMPPIIVVPGLGGSGETHWQTYLEQSLAHSLRVQQDDWARPELANWVERLRRAVELQPEAILVAHSLGCVLVAHLAARYPDLQIKAALLVAPADVDSARHTPPHIRGFAPVPRQPLPFHSIVVASTNDPYITIERARQLADSWLADFVDVGAVGHINVQSGFGRWAEGEAIVDALTAQAAARSGNFRRTSRLAAGAW
jgi:predicted alpha/beta hydrolase family esterase